MEKERERTVAENLEEDTADLMEEDLMAEEGLVAGLMAEVALEGAGTAGVVQVVVYLEEGADLVVEATGLVTTVAEVDFVGLLLVHLVDNLEAVDKVAAETDLASLETEVVLAVKVMEVESMVVEDMEVVEMDTETLVVVMMVAADEEVAATEEAEPGEVVTVAAALEVEETVEVA